MYWLWPDLGLDCYKSFFANIQQFWPLVNVEVLFPLNIFWTNQWNFVLFCICIDINQIHVGFLCVKFCIFPIELWSLIIVKILFPPNIDWERIEGIRPNFRRCIDVDKIEIGIVTQRLSQLYNTVIALGYCQNFVSAQYLVQELMEFNQVMHMHWLLPVLL